VELIRDLLDNQLLDRHGKKLGKVDSVVLSVSDGAAPRVVAIETGALAFAERLHLRLTRWLTALARRHRLPLGRTRIPWARVVRVGLEVHVAVDAERTRAHALERWLRTRVIARMPGIG
jgi:sporulation protein YlmC with PRC-barrel domain